MILKDFSIIILHENNIQSFKTDRFCHYYYFLQDINTRYNDVFHVQDLFNIKTFP